MANWLAKAVYSDGSEEEKEFPIVGYTLGVSMDKEKGKIEQFMKTLKEENNIECTSCAVSIVE